MEDVLQLSPFVKLKAYVDSSNKLAVNVELGVSWPVGILFETLTDLLILENIKAAILNTVFVNEVDNLLTETALGLLRRSFHEEHHILLVDQFLDPSF